MIRTPGAVVGPVMPQVTGTWGHKLWREAQSRNYPLPCPGHWVYYTSAVAHPRPKPHKTDWEEL